MEELLLEKGKGGRSESLKKGEVRSWGLTSIYFANVLCLVILLDQGKNIRKGKTV